MAIQSYRDLTVWQDAIALATVLYRLTANFPKDELYGLTTQIRRAGVSVAANIAEGRGRETTKLFIQFLRTAQGSLKEVETHLIISEQAALLDRQALDSHLLQCESLGKRLRALIRTLQDKVGRDE